MIDVIFYEGFNKRKNSTKQPSGGTTLKCLLKDDTSCINPSIELQTKASPQPYNYCRIPLFGRYYFINDWTYNKGVWTASCNVDALATYKSSILGYTAFVERSASNYDIWINDNELSQEQKYARVDTDSIQSPFDDVGCFVVSINGITNELTSTGTQLYAMRADTLRQFMLWMYDEGTWSDYFVDGFVKAVFDPMDWVNYIKWIPFSIEELAPRWEQQIRIGYWDTHVTAAILDSFGFNKTFNMSSFTKVYNDWRDNNPNYTQYTLYLPGYGDFDIPPDVFHYFDDLDIVYALDFTTSNCNIQLRHGTHVISNLNANLGADIKASSVSINSMSAVTDVFSMFGAAFQGNLAGAVSGGASSITNMIKPIQKSIGQAGTIYNLKYNNIIRLTRYQYGNAEYPTNVSGRPLCKNVQLSTLSGYTKCGKASVPMIGYATEKDQVNSYLNGGFYIE